MKRYKLLKDISTPSFFHPKGSICEKDGNSYFITNKNEWRYYISGCDITNTEWFEELEEPLYTKKQLIEFGYIARRSLHGQIDILANDFASELENPLNEF